MKPRKRRTKTEMYPLVQTWLASEQSKPGFCEAHQVNLHTFTYWLQKYRESGQQAASPAFVRIATSQPFSAGAAYIIHYPNGVQLQINERISGEELSKLIRCAQP